MKEKVTYIASDGKEFDDKNACIEYENGNAKMHNSWKRITDIIDALNYEIQNYESIDESNKVSIIKDRNGIIKPIKENKNIKKSVDDLMKILLC